MERNSVVDSLKGIAILGIVFIHFSQFFPVGILESVSDLGARGVQLMFVINGYLTSISLENLEMRKESIFHWYKKKVLRIIPFYWLASFIYLALFKSGNEFWLGPLDRISLTNVVCNLLCIHGFYPYYINAINGNWFVADLMIWYLIAPFMWKIFKNFQKTIVLICIYILVICIVTFFLNKLGLKGAINSYFGLLWLPAEFPAILMGVIVYHFKKIKINKSISYAVMILIIFTLGCLGIGFSNFNLFNVVITWSVCFAIILFLQLNFPWKIIVNRLFSLLGKYSLGIYLSHYILIRVAYEILNEYIRIKNVRESFILLLLICICSFSFAVIIENFFRMIEKKLVNRCM